MRELAAQAAEQSDIVFEGRMGPAELKEGTLDRSGNLSSRTQGHYMEIQFSVARVYRGKSKSRFVVLANDPEIPCGLYISSLDDYLVSAKAIPGTTHYVTDAGMLTVPVERSGPALRLFRGVPPREEDLLEPKAYDDFIHAQFGSVCGQVVSTADKPLPDAVVTLWSVDDDGFPPKYQRGNADANGSFCIRDVADGRYWLGAEKYSPTGEFRLLGYYPAGTDRSKALPVEVAAKSKVSGLRIALQEEGRHTVTFRVIPAKGNFHSKPAALIFKSKNGDPLYYFEASSVIDADGVCRLPLKFAPGRYLVSTFFGLKSNAAAVGLLAAGADIPMREQEIAISRSGELVLRIMPPD